MVAEAFAPERGFEPLPPHSDDAEESVLGSLLIDAEAIASVVSFLQPVDFYHPRNRDLYRAMIGLHERGEPTDFVMVCDELDRLGISDRVGGVAHVARLLTVVPTAVHVEHYARIVERTALSRRLISAAGRIAAIGYEDETDFDGAMAKVQDELAAVTAGHVSTARASLLKLDAILGTYLESIGAETSTANAERVPSGFLDIDHLLGGFARGDLIVIAARPGAGKSALGLNILRNLTVDRGGRGLLYSLEMSHAQLAGRMVSAESSVDSFRIREGRLGHEDISRIITALDKLQGIDLWIDDKPANTLAGIRATAKRLQDTEGRLDLIVVDYLQQVEGTGGRGVNVVQQVSAVSAGLKNLARELDVPVIALSQLSRAVESRKPAIPILSDLRDSGSIEQDADVCAFIYREEMYDRETEHKGVAELHVLKHRNGPTGIVRLMWAERFTTFRDLHGRGGIDRA